jgi:hypothetical protein
MPPVIPCPSGCLDPCVDCHDWERCPQCHAPFHYWRWFDLDPETSKQRLGERVYICACLFWTALHDRRLGQRLLSQNPNWSAVCNYYSMVHSLRLFWFLLYGSYPTGHAQLAQGMRGGWGARADWRIERLRRADKRISASAFQALLQDEFNASKLSLEIPLTGSMFEDARRLRNDSNYESLILAHQYFHGNVEVNIPDEMARTANAMSQASLLVLRFVTEIIDSVFRSERPWVGNGSQYSGADLKALLWRYVHDKIRGASGEQHPDSVVLADWVPGMPELKQEMTNAESRADNPAHELVGSIRYTVFRGKQSLMMDFQEEATRLETAVYRITRDGTSQSGLFG